MTKTRARADQAIAAHFVWPCLDDTTFEVVRRPDRRPAPTVRASPSWWERLPRDAFVDEIARRFPRGCHGR